jgi:transposase
MFLRSSYAEVYYLKQISCKYINLTVQLSHLNAFCGDYHMRYMLLVQAAGVDMFHFCSDVTSYRITVSDVQCF